MEIVYVKKIYDDDDEVLSELSELTDFTAEETVERAICLLATGANVQMLALKAIVGHFVQNKCTGHIPELLQDYLPEIAELDWECRNIYELCDAYRYFSMVHVTPGNIIRVENVMIPNAVPIDECSQNELDNVSVRVNGQVKILQGTGSNLIEFVKPKYDGIPMIALSYSENNVPYTLIVTPFESCVKQVRWCWYGELVDTDVYMSYGTVIYDSITEFDFNHRSVKIHYENSLYFNVLPRIDRTDGVVLGIGGKEYKLKYQNTIDLRYVDGRYESANGTPYEVRNAVKAEEGAVYEVTLTGSVLRKRCDKVIPNTNARINAIKDAITYVRFSELMVTHGVDCIDNGVHSDAISFADAERLLGNHYKEREKLVMTPITICQELVKMQIVLPMNVVTQLYKRITGGKPIAGRFIKHVPAGPKVVVVAGKGEILAEMSRTMCTLAPRDLAYMIAQNTGKRVSTHRIYTMCVRGELCNTRSGVMRNKVDSSATVVLRTIPYKLHEGTQLADYLTRFMEANEELLRYGFVGDGLDNELIEVIRYELRSEGNYVKLGKIVENKLNIDQLGAVMYNIKTYDCVLTHGLCFKHRCTKNKVFSEGAKVLVSKWKSLKL